jgi:hypothetical protein
MTDLDSVPGGVGPGLLLAVVDAGAGWLLYDAVAPVLGIALWLVAALVAGGLFVDAVGRPVSIGRSPGPRAGE